MLNPRSTGTRERPRVVMTLIVRDEADIIGDLIQFHLESGVDLILALDHRSEDGTSNILKELEHTGRVRYLYEPSKAYLQDAWFTNLARRAHLEHDADWIIHGDADEFFIPRVGTLKDVLRNIRPEIGAISVKRHDMIPIVRPMLESPPLEMTYRKRESLEWVKGHPILDKVIHRGVPDAKVSRGAHAVEAGSIHQTDPCPNIFTFHFPIRSLAQFTSKVRHVGGARIRLGLPGSRYDRWYSALLEGKLDAVFAEYELDQEQITQKLASGEIVEDRRLADALSTLRDRKS